MPSPILSAEQHASSASKLYAACAFAVVVAAISMVLGWHHCNGHTLMTIQVESTHLLVWTSLLSRNNVLPYLVGTLQKAIAAHNTSTHLPS